MNNILNILVIALIIVFIIVMSIELIIRLFSLFFKEKSEEIYKNNDMIEVSREEYDKFIKEEVDISGNNMNYRDHPALNHSKLKDIDKSPLYFYEKHIAKNIPEEKTKALILGTLFHNTCFDKINALSFVDIEKLSDLEPLNKMRDNLFKKETWKALIELSEIEVPMYFDYNGIECKAQLDIKNDNFIADLKTTASLDSFNIYSIRKYGYHTQAAFYRKAAENYGDYYLIVCEKQAPYDIAFYKMPEYLIEEGRQLNEQRLELYKQCMEFNDWPGRPDQIVTLF